MNRSRVLVVEDWPSVLTLMATILEDGYEVTTASDGERAISILGEADFEVVLTDVRMPGRNGFEVLQAVRANSQRTAVVLMTAYASVPDAVEAMRLGADDYVIKPLEADAIALTLARAVERRRCDPLPASPLDGSAWVRVEGDGTRTTSQNGYHRAIEEARDDASRAYLVGLLRQFRGNVTHASTHARITRESLHRVLRKYGIRSEDYRGAGAGNGDDEGLPA